MLRLLHGNSVMQSALLAAPGGRYGYGYGYGYGDGRNDDGCYDG
jgi:hypothetical protein